jgi:WD40 repeat protein/tetratricopeptide (TPR) repeat protein
MVAAASSIYGKVAHVWETATGTRIDPGLAGMAVTCLPDEATFAVLGPGGMSFWNPEEGMRDGVLPYSGGNVAMVACSDDGSRLATGGFDRKVHVWDLATGDPPRVFDGPEFAIFSVALSPDARWVAAASPPQLFMWDVEGAGKPIVLNQEVENAFCVSFAEDGATLVSGGLDGRIRLWDIQSRQRKGILRTTNSAGVYSVACSSDGRVAAGAEDGSVTLWNVADGEQIDVLKGHRHSVWSVAFSHDGRRLASGSMDGEVRTWDVSNRRPPDELRDSTQQFNGVVFSPDGSVVVTASTDHIVRLWDAQTGEPLEALPAHRSWIYDLTVSPAGNYVASVCMNGEVWVWDLALGAEKHVLQQFMPLSACFSPDGQSLAIGGAGRQLHLFDTSTGTQVIQYKGVGKQIRTLAISPDGQTLASGGWDSTIMLWEFSTGRHVGTLAGHSRDVTSLAFSPDDSNMLASSAGDGTVKLWDVAGRNERQTLRGHSATVFSVAFSPDGSILASGAGDSTVKLWYLGKNREPESLPTDGPALSVAFSPDGETLACAAGNTVRFWRTVAVAGSDALDRRRDLQRRARAIVESEPQQQRRALADLRNHLAAAAVNGMRLRDITMATSTAWRLEEGGQAELAEEAIRSFCEAIRGSTDPRLLRLMSDWEVALWEQRAGLCLEGGQLDEAIANFTKAIELNPNDSQLRLGRGQLHVRLGQWGEAAADYGRRVELTPTETIAWLQAAPLFVLADNLEGYREHCRCMVARFGASDELPVAERTIKVCLLLPDAVVDLGPSLSRLQSALDDGSAPDGMRKWGYMALALAAHRADNAKTALECITKSQQSPGYRAIGPEAATLLCLMAMAQHQLRNRDEASEALVQADTLVDEYLRKLASGEFKGWHDWLIAEILRREATELIAGPTKEPTPEAKATAKPKTQ